MGPGGGASYLLFFFVVLFFAEEAFLVVDFLADFLAAMALVPPFLAGTVKVRKKIVNDFLLARNFFSAHPAARVSRSRGG